MEKKEISKSTGVPETVQRKAQIKVGIFLLVAITLFIAVAINNRQRQKLPKEEVYTSPYEFSLYGINTNSYHFVNEITIDGVTTTYKGIVYKEMMKFSDDTDEFYKDNDKYYKKADNEWKEFNMGHNLMEFMTSKSIEEILKSAMFDNKVEYKDKTIIYNYKILTDNLVDIFDKNHIDIDSQPNLIALTAGAGNEVTEVSYDLSSYCKYKGYGENVSSKITYRLFGSVKSIEEQV